MADDPDEVTRPTKTLNRRLKKLNGLVAKSQELYDSLKGLIRKVQSRIVLGGHSPSLAQQRARLEQFSAIVKQAMDSYEKRLGAFAESASAPDELELPNTQRFDPADAQFGGTLKDPPPLEIDWDEATRESLRAIGGLNWHS
jgi:hypothetical protein